MVRPETRSRSCSPACQRMAVGHSAMTASTACPGVSRRSSPEAQLWAAGPGALHGRCAHMYKARLASWVTVFFSAQLFCPAVRA